MSREGLERLAQGRARALVVAAHPDDEVVGAGGLLARSRGAHVAFLSDGAPRGRALWARGLDVASPAEYAAVRARESEAALAHLGVAPERTARLGARDQEVALALAPLAVRLAALVVELRPDVVVTHPYEGGHPDHDGAAVVTWAALELARARGVGAAAVEMTSYHAPAGRLVVAAFLPGPGAEERVVLSPAERERKAAALAAYVSQRDALAPFRPPAAIERLRGAPRYDFTRPPHAGPLHYERLGWALTGAQVCALAGEALEALGLARPGRRRSAS